MPIETDRERLMFQCADALHSCSVEIAAWVDGKSQRIVRQHGQRFLLFYVQLHRQATHIMEWRLYPTRHLFAHCLDESLCPRDIWAYGFESEIGACARMCRRCNGCFLHSCLHFFGRHRSASTMAMRSNRSLSSSLSCFFFGGMFDSSRYHRSLPFFIDLFSVVFSR